MTTNTLKVETQGEVLASKNCNWIKEWAQQWDLKKVGVESVAGVDSQRQEATERRQQQEGKSWKQAERPGASLRDYHGVNSPPLARVWSNHQLPEIDNSAQMSAATQVGGE